MEDIIYEKDYRNQPETEEDKRLSVIFDRKAYQISGKLFSKIADYIDDNYVDEHTDILTSVWPKQRIFRIY